jgi:hypothetical protein
LAVEALVVDQTGSREPSLTGGAYINFLSAEGQERVKAAYGAEKFARLQDLKDRYDPSNLFHLNQTCRRRAESAPARRLLI